ncbi:unnamed protein product [Rotaria sordida]|uniref:EGF-like domain-containing protein n=1 Tax=Rotaria sordida TaxID=392033 RepID=A0A814UD76_9BILA|nr:unnamed protein product [Rotaria sordida]CAF1209108.1 unnamed protein product [Rotaria sordida]CAF3847911.1 unnamed protein product [Rotaria sordida]CAF4050296.1 unnamed protein product [Rotaria sordida]
MLQIDNNLTCQNGSRRIPVDEYTLFNKKILCICPKDYVDDQCEIAENKMILSFGFDIGLFQSIFIYFIEVINDVTPIFVKIHSLRRIKYYHIAISKIFIEYYIFL